MPTVHQDIEIRSKGTQILDNVISKLGVLHKDGIRMGIAFAGVNASINLVQQAFAGYMSYIQEGITAHREFEASLARIQNAMGTFSTVTIQQVKDQLLTMSVAYGTNVNIIASSLEKFIREGASIKDALQQVATAERLALVTREELSAATETVNTTMEVFNLSVESTGYTSEKINEIWSKTGVSLTELSNILGVNATKIRENGLNLQDFEYIIMELDSQGLKGRGMISAFRDIMEDYGKTLKTVTQGQQNFNKAIGDIPDISSKLKTITSTTELTQQILDQVKQWNQMDFTKALDFGGLGDKGTVKNAQMLFGLLNDQGISTLEAFNAELKRGSTLAIYGAKTPLYNIDETTIKLIQMFYYQNKQAAEQLRSQAIGAVEDFNKKLEKNQEILSGSTTSIATYGMQLKDIGIEIGNLTAIHDVNTELHYMELGLKNASYASRIVDDSTRALINTLRSQRDQVKALTRENEAYNIISTTNSIEQMKLQLATMSHGGRMSREARNHAKELERISLELRIKETENQLSMDKIQYDMTPEQYRLDNIKTMMNEELYIYQSTYNKEIQALQDKISATEALIEQERSKRTGALSFITEHASIIPTPNLVGDRGGVWRGGRQFGGPIMATGLYTLHQGEYVVPKSGGNASRPVVINVNAKLDVRIDNRDNLDALRSKLGQLIMEGTIQGISTAAHLGG